MEPIQQSPTGSTNWGGKMTCTLSRNGDLLYKTYIVFNLPVITTLKSTSSNNTKCVYVNECGYSLLSNVSVEIGGTTFDSVDGLMLSVYHELAVPSEKNEGLCSMVGKIPDSQLRHPTTYYTKDSIINPLNDRSATTSAFDYDPFVLDHSLSSELPELHVPLHTMFFHRNPGNAIPLVALMYHETRLQIQLASESSCIRRYVLPANSAFGDRAQIGPADPIHYNLSGTQNPSVEIWSDYVYLDQEERSRVAQMQHEILFEQVQEQRNENALYAFSTTTQKTTVQKIKLLFNHPCKFFAFVAIPNNPQYFSSPFVCSRFPDNARKLINPAPFIDAKITMNQHDRVVTRSAVYYTKTQPYQAAPCVPDHHRPIGLYSFSLNAFDTQPSGTCNMSRIDTTQLQLTLAQYAGGVIEGSKENLDNVAKSWIANTTTNYYGDREIVIMTMNYNIMKISSGMAGVGFSN
jgi:hypothetical protein